jgi:hypothetical protein
MLHLTWEPFDQYDSSKLSGYQPVNQETLCLLSLLYTFLHKHYVMHSVVELFVINFIIFVLSRFSTNLLAVNHSIIRVRNKFNTVQRSPKFLLYIITLVSSAKVLVLIWNLFS